MMIIFLDVKYNVSVFIKTSDKKISTSLYPHPHSISFRMKKLMITKTIPF